MRKRGIVSKRAISNVEMSVALVLFVGMVFAIILMFNVFYKPVSRDHNLLDDFEKKFMAEAKDYTMVGVHASGDIPNCFNVSFNDNLKKTDADYIGVFYKDELIDKRIEGENLFFENVEAGFYEVYNFSFPVIKTQNLFLNPWTCAGTKYAYTIPIKGKIFDSQDLLNIRKDYTLNYAGLEEKFGVNFEIAFVGYELPPDLDMKKRAPVGAEVLAKNFFIKIYDRSKEKIKDVQVNIRVWR